LSRNTPVDLLELICPQLTKQLKQIINMHNLIVFIDVYL
jgi:hypothetical protein